MKKIIALQGKDNTGKTETLKYLLDKILVNGKAVASERNFQARMQRKNWDVWSLLEYHGKCIAITSRGDADRFIKQDFYAMEQEAKVNGKEIDIYICAVHTSGKTVDYIQRKAKTLGAPVYIYGKTLFFSSDIITQNNMRNKINNEQAQFIFDNL